MMREKRRYILFEVISEVKVDKRRLQNAIWDSFYSLYGDTGASRSRLWLVCYDSGIGLLKCSHRMVEEVRAALACIHSINGMRVAIRVIRVSGTIRGALKGYSGVLPRNISR